MVSFNLTGKPPYPYVITTRPYKRTACKMKTDSWRNSVNICTNNPLPNTYATTQTSFDGAVPKVARYCTVADVRPPWLATHGPPPTPRSI